MFCLNFQGAFYKDISIPTMVNFKVVFLPELKRKLFIKGITALKL